MDTEVRTANPEYAWAEYLHCMEGTPEMDSLPAAKRTAASPVWGILLCLVMTVVSIWMSGFTFWPFLINGHPTFEPVMISIVIGLILGNIMPLAVFQPGIKFSVKKMLPLGIILLGAKLDFKQILQLGAVGVTVSCFEVIMALILMFFLTKWLKLSSKLGTLLGIGTAICGGTAIVAAAPVLEAEEAEVVFGVATVTLLGLIGMFILPVLGHWMAMSDKAFGIWAGLSIHQLPQVVAAGMAFSPEAGAQATIVKLARICLLAPIVFLVGFFYTHHKAKKDQKVSPGKKINYFSMFPKFVFGFLAFAFLQTKGWLPDLTIHFPGQMASTQDPQYHLRAIVLQCSTFFIVMSMAGVGLETKISAMKQTGWRPLLAAGLSALIIALVILTLIKLLVMA